METMYQVTKRTTGLTPYLLDNAGEQAGDRFDALSAIFDPGTIRHIEGLGITSGWHCLEVGGGGGSIAKWLTTRIGATGHVLATDIDTRYLETLRSPVLEVRRHNIIIDQLPEAAFDLVHARLVLMHLPDRELAIRHMIGALKPGGWLLVEEFDALSLYPDPNVCHFETSTKTSAALRKVMTDGGVDLRYGRRLSWQLREHGLGDVGAEGRLFMWQAGSVGAALVRSNYEQLHDLIIDTGLVSEHEYKHDLERLKEDYLGPSPIMWAAWGRLT